MNNIYGIQKKSKAYIRPKEETYNPYKLNIKKENRSFTNSQRKAIYDKNNGICQICKKPVTWKNFHADHIIPWTKGGKTTISNGQCTHSKCNIKKGNKFKKKYINKYY